MRLYESEAKQVFAREGIPVPRAFGVVRSPEEFDGLAVEYPAMVKALVLIGGRGKAGGVRKVKDAAEGRAAVADILSKTIKGFPVEAVLVEQVAPEQGAAYLGVTTDPGDFELVLIASPSGGVEIETVAKEHPEQILKLKMHDNPRALPEALAEEATDFVARGLHADDAQRQAIGGLLRKLFATFQAYDCKVAEINPMLLVPGGAIAADAKIVLDDNALYRHRDLFEVLGVTDKRHDVAEPSANETRAAEAGFTYVDLLPADAVKDPDTLYVGLVPGGAGYGIFSIDEVVNVGRRYFDGKVVPLNFMDSGGGPSVAKVAKMFDLLMDHPLVDLIVTSRFGGISSCDTFVRGLIDCLRSRHAAGRRIVPVHGRMVGTDLPSARSSLQLALQETPEPLADMHIVVGNQKIMFEVIRDGVQAAWDKRQEVAR